jgi:succinoglycan biosynthesis transport protein ExoP
MSFTQIILALRARWWIAVLTLVIAVGAAAGISLITTPKYKAIATVIVDYKGTETISGTPSVVAFSPAYLATQVDIIESHRVALRVVKNLKLADNPVARAQFKEATDGRGSVEDWLADSLLNNLKVTPSKESSVINLEYTASDARFAALMANAFAKAYIDTHLELRTDPARDVATWFDGQLKELRGNLEKAQTKLSEYQRSSGIVATDERVDMENTKLSELSSQVVALQGQTADLISRRRQIEDAIRAGKSLDDIPEVGGNSMVM